MGCDVRPCVNTAARAQRRGFDQSGFRTRDQGVNALNMVPSVRACNVGRWLCRSIGSLGDGKVEHQRRRMCGCRRLRRSLVYVFVSDCGCWMWRSADSSISFVSVCVIQAKGPLSRPNAREQGLGNAPSSCKFFFSFLRLSLAIGGPSPAYDLIPGVPAAPPG